MRWATLAGLLGLAVATALFVWRGIDDVLANFAAAGIGILWSALFHFASMSLNARAWQVLLPDWRRPSLLFFVWAVWLRESVNAMLPVARVGGEIVTARLLVSHGVRMPTSVASLVVDVTLTVASQAIFALLGLGLLLMMHGGSDTTMQITLGLLIATPIIGLIFAVQRSGLFSLLFRVVHALFGDRFAALAGGAAALDRKVRRFYHRRSAILACGWWQLLGWIAGAGELWLAARFMGHPISLTDAIIIEAVIQALSSAVFFVPGALGVQEGGFLLIGQLIGLPADIALALALARRARDIIVFVPALLWFQLQHSRAWLRAQLSRT